MSRAYRQFPRRRGPVIALPSAAPYLSYWVQPPNQPLRSRIRKRQQPAPPQLKFPPQPSAAPYITYWAHPTNQPQIRRKAREIEIVGGAISSVTQAPYVSCWKHPTEQPVRTRNRLRQQPPAEWVPLVSNQSTVNVTNDLTFWAQDVNQPLRNRLPKRQQPPQEWVPAPPFSSAAPYVSYWKQPTNEPRIVKRRQQPQYYGQFWAIDIDRVLPPLEAFVRPVQQPLNNRKPKRQQPTPTMTPVFWSANQPFNSILASQWYKPTNQPLRSRTPRRQQPRYSTQFLPPLPSQAPYISYWRPPLSQPLRNRVSKRQQPQYPLGAAYTPSDGLANVPPDVFKHQVEQPLRKRYIKRQQPVYPLNPAWVAATGLSYVVPLSFHQPTAQPRITKKRQQPNRTPAAFTAPDGLQSVPLLSWQRSTSPIVRKAPKRQQPQLRVVPTQPVRSWISLGGSPSTFRRPKRQQPLPNWNPWYEAMANANLVSQWQRARERQVIPKRKRQQPVTRSGWGYANIYPYFPVPLEGWKQPVQQPLRRSRQMPRYIPRPAVVLLALQIVHRTLPIILGQRSGDGKIILDGNNSKRIIL